LITLRVKDEFRGRVFSVDMMVHLVVLGVSSWLGGRLLDELGVPPRQLMAGVAVTVGLAGVVWWLIQPRPPPGLSEQSRGHGSP
ncbi:MAG TPA: hypothetical protein VGE37_16965, partial [Archangium sp.]